MTIGGVQYHNCNFWSATPGQIHHVSYPITSIGYQVIPMVFIGFPHISYPRKIPKKKKKYRMTSGYISISLTFSKIRTDWGCIHHDSVTSSLLGVLGCLVRKPDGASYRSGIPQNASFTMKNPIKYGWHLGTWPSTNLHVLMDPPWTLTRKWTKDTSSELLIPSQMRTMLVYESQHNCPKTHPVL